MKLTIRPGERKTGQEERLPSLSLSSSQENVGFHEKTGGKETKRRKEGKESNKPKHYSLVLAWPSGQVVSFKGAGRL